MTEEPLRKPNRECLTVVKHNTSLIALALGAVMLGVLSGCINTPFGRATIFDGLFRERYDPTEDRKRQELQEIRNRHEVHLVYVGRRWGDTLTATVGPVLERYIASPTRRPPAHAATLVADGFLKPQDFLLPGSRTDPSRIPVGHTDLATFATLAPHEQRAAVRAAADALPDDVVAHRLGDFVFVYHGLTSTTDKLTAMRDGYYWYKYWRVIASPDPDFNETDPPGYHHYMAKLDGWGPSLREQNGRRSMIRLAPLPDPKTVRHGEPVTAPPDSRQAEFVALDNVRRTE
jgi:hypothetical protein